MDSHTVRIIDLVFITRDESGVTHSRELTEIESDLMLTWDPLVDDVLGLLSGDDIQRLGQSLSLNSSAALLLFENTWATDFRDAAADAVQAATLLEGFRRSLHGRPPTFVLQLCEAVLCGLQQRVRPGY